MALIGYYLAATVVDNRYIGRLRLQLLGFAMVAILFYVSAIWYHPLTSKGGIHVFQFVSAPASCPPDRHSRPESKDTDYSALNRIIHSGTHDKIGGPYS